MFLPLISPKPPSSSASCDLPSESSYPFFPGPQASAIPPLIGPQDLAIPPLIGLKEIVSRDEYFLRLIIINKYFLFYMSGWFLQFLVS